MTKINFTINNEHETIEAPPLKRLLDVLREDLHLTGAKEGCGEGECGSCSVLMNGELVNSCLVPALQAEGANITTIEGIAHQARQTPPHPTMLPRTRRSPVRHLHPRHDPRHPPPARKVSATNPVTNPGRPRRKPLPLHRLRPHLRRRPGRSRPTNHKPGAPYLASATGFLRNVQLKPCIQTQPNTTSSPQPL